MPSDPASFYERRHDADDGAAPDSPPQGSAYIALLKNSNFRYWFSSSFISALGDWIGFVALTALVPALFEEGSTGGLYALGTLLMVRLLPSAIFGPLGGVIADRYDRKKLIVITDILRAGLYGAIALTDDILALFALTFIVEIVSLLFLSAKDASLPSVVDEEHLTEANQLNLLVSYGTMPLGAVSTAVMVAVSGSIAGFLSIEEVDPLRVALVIDAVTYLISAVLMAKVVLPGERQRRAEVAENETNVLDELKDGLRFIRSYPVLRSLIEGIVGVFFGAGLVIGLGSVFVSADLGRPESDWAIMLSSVGIGLVIGIVALVPVLKRFDQETTFTIFLSAVGIVAALTAFSPSFAIALPMGALLGGAAGVAVVQGYTLIHEHTVDETRARTFGLFYSLSRIALFLALGIGPFFAGGIDSLGISIGSGTLSGVRVTLFVGGLVAAWFGIRARTSITNARKDPSRPLAVTAPSRRPWAHKGLFITFEGVEGAGKSTQIRLLAEALEAEGHEVVVTREPGGAPLAERIRELVLDPNTDDMDARTEALLIAAARADHVQRRILPALKEGAIVLCDRFVDSSLAYQGHARGLGVDDVREVNRWATDGVFPDVTVLLKLDPSEGMRRVEGRIEASLTPDGPPADAAPEGEDGARLFHLPPITHQVAKDRMEVEGLEFHSAVAKGYLSLAREEKGRYVVVDAHGEPDGIQRQVRAGLHQWLPLPLDDGPRAEPHADEGRSSTA